MGDEEEDACNTGLGLGEVSAIFKTTGEIQKQTLAAKLNLRTRQVEVWFQNRRARTKSKQSEVECELLKKWCESLSHENHRLQKELRELRLFNLDQPHDQLPMAVTLTICPSCSQQHQ
ncbi:homeobox-leucine zipper protein 3 [Actinidia rufa]|uniref:Homeobox-leucine zipper protein 3 n=1 Tax=Actinidia rufa TaxID=165716 RepID=A0A7J0GD49_9ERIC|nr:homeobox-leucine zipper protein 3 [Actinidia rufa]